MRGIKGVQKHKRGDMIKRFSFLIIIAMLFSCTNSLLIMKNNEKKPAKVKVNILLTDPSQKVLADTLGNQMLNRLVLFSEDRGDFVLTNNSDSADFVIQILITSFQIFSTDSQIEQSMKRKKVENKYEKQNDIIEQKYKPMSSAELTAANVAVNVIANVALLPLGVISISVISDRGPAYVMPSYRDQKAIASTYSMAFFTYEAQLIKGKDVVIRMRDHEQFLLNYISPELEQIRVLTRNAEMKIADRFPFFKQLSK